MRRAPTFRASALILAVVAGCAPRQATVTVGPPLAMIPALPDVCGAAAQTSLIGTHFTGLARVSPPGGLRVLWPGQEVNEQVIPLRLNAQVSDTGRIIRLFCG